MSALRGLNKRVLRIESRVMPSGSPYVPHSPEWWDYWNERVDRLANGASAASRIPIDYIDAVVQRARQDSGTRAHTGGRGEHE